MYPSPSSNNHEVGVGEPKSAASSQSFKSSSGSGGDSSPSSTRSGPPDTVDSRGAPQEGETPDSASPTISETSTCSNSPIPQQQHQLFYAWPQSTNDPSMSDPCQLIVEYMGACGYEVAECFRTATELPPITLESLAELDMPRIINNPKLRHDCNFDRELHFRPNLDGPKGRQKIKSAEDYWKALEGELFVYGLVHRQRRDPQNADSQDSWRSLLLSCQKRLPQIFHAVRDILKTLVPDCDQKTILDRLDVDLIMQEILNGVCDLIDLGNWLATVLKHHCAPMRDSLVDAMQAEITRGASEEKPERLVNGIRQLLNILEAMKLDVANHQIRHMRPLLVEDTVNFQRKYNSHRIAVGKLDIGQAYLWMEDEINILMCDDKPSLPLQAICSGVLKSLIFWEQAPVYPRTFYLDDERLKGLRVDLHSMIYHLVCRDVLVAMAGPSIPKRDLADAITALETTVSAIVGMSGRFPDRLGNIAAEIMRIVLLLENRDVTFDATLLDFVENQLEEDLRIYSSSFQKHGQDLYDKLLPRLQTSVDQHKKLTALRLQDQLLPPPTLPIHPHAFGFGAILAPAPIDARLDPEEDIIRRFTHLIVLHWQVWVDLVYVGTAGVTTPHPSMDDSPEGNPWPSSTSSSSESNSPTVPVAHAVYAPGKKWLPVGVETKNVPIGLPTPAASPKPDVEDSSELDDDQNSPEARRSSQSHGPKKQPAA